MHPQLQAIVDEFQSAEARLDRLPARVPFEVWGRRPDPNRWSAAECVAHLNLTSRAYLSLLERAVNELHDRGPSAPRRFRRDLAGWMLWRVMGPPVRFKVKTPPAFVPGSLEPPERLIEDFRVLQATQIAATAACDGYDLMRVRVVSPFNARLKYNVYSCLSILPRHQHRHLWQAEQTRST